MKLSSANTFLRNHVCFFLITLIGLAIYSNTFSVPFLFDDIDNIVDNYIIKNTQYFTTPSALLNNRSFGYLTFLLNYQINGLNVMYYHFVNLAIHIVNSFMVYQLICRILHTPYFSTLGDNTHKNPNRTQLALSPSLLFLCHPLHTGAVTYIVQRFTLLATFFYLIASIMYIMARNHMSRTNRWQSGRFVFYYAIAILGALLAMKCKEIAFTLPIMITVIELFFYKAPVKTRIYLLLPFLATMAIIPLSLFLSDHTSVGIIQKLATVTHQNEQLSRFDYFLTQSRVVATYIRLLLLPLDQNIDYDYPVIHSMFQYSAVASYALHAFIIGFAIITLKKHRTGGRLTRLAAFGIVWFYVTLAVESSIIPLDDIIFEHRLYLPSIGMIIPITTGLIMASNRLPSRYAGATQLIIASVILILAVATYTRNGIWQSGLSLWSDAVKKSPHKARPHYSLGSYLASNGELDAAMNEFRKAMEIDPGNSMGHNNFGHALLGKGDVVAAIEEFRQAVALDPTNKTARRNLGAALSINGNTASALIELHTAVQLAPYDAKAHNNLGYTLYLSGDTEAALREFRETLKLDPADTKAHKHLSNITAERARSLTADRALHDHKKTVR